MEPLIWPRDSGSISDMLPRALHAQTDSGRPWQRAMMGRCDALITFGTTCCRIFIIHRPRVGFLSDLLFYAHSDLLFYAHLMRIFTLFSHFHTHFSHYFMRIAFPKRWIGWRWAPGVREADAALEARGEDQPVRSIQQQGTVPQQLLQWHNPGWLPWHNGVEEESHQSLDWRRRSADYGLFLAV